MVSPALALGRVPPGVAGAQFPVAAPGLPSQAPLLQQVEQPIVSPVYPRTWMQERGAGMK